MGGEIGSFLQWGSLGMKAGSGLAGFFAGEDAAEKQLELSKIQAQTYNVAAEINESQAEMTYRMAESNSAQYLAYAEQLVTSGEIDYSSIEREAQRAAADVWGQAEQAAGAAKVGAAGRNISLSSRAVIEQLHNIVDAAQSDVTDILYEKSAAQTRTMLKAEMDAGSAKIQAQNEVLQGIISQTQIQQQAAGQRAQSIAAIAVGEMQRGQATSRGMSNLFATGVDIAKSGATLLTKGTTKTE